MEPENSSAAGNQRGAGKLQHVAMLLNCPFDADGTPGCFGFGAATAALGTGKQNAPPVGAFESHGPIAGALGIRDADGFDTVSAAEAGHLRSSPLHHASDANAALVELGERLAQLRECF